MFNSHRPHMPTFCHRFPQPNLWLWAPRSTHGLPGAAATNLPLHNAARARVTGHRFSIQLSSDFWRSPSQICSKGQNKQPYAYGFQAMQLPHYLTVSRLWIVRFCSMKFMKLTSGIPILMERPTGSILYQAHCVRCRKWPVHKWLLVAFSKTAHTMVCHRHSRNPAKHVSVGKWSIHCKLITLIFYLPKFLLVPQFRVQTSKNFSETCFFYFWRVSFSSIFLVWSKRGLPVQVSHHQI